MFSDNAILQAANENKTEIIYHLLLQKDEISTSLFEDCSSLELMSIPSTIESINQSAFKN